MRLEARQQLVGLHLLATIDIIAALGVLSSQPSRWEFAMRVLGLATLLTVALSACGSDGTADPLEGTDVVVDASVQGQPDTQSGDGALDSDAQVVADSGSEQVQNGQDTTPSGWDAAGSVDGSEASDAGPEAAPDVPVIEEPEGPVDPADFCASISLPVRPFETEGDFGTGRHQKAADFSFPQFDGTAWSLSESWTGCDSYIFLGSARTNSGLDNTSVWVRDLMTLLQISKPNVHYFFVPTRTTGEAMGEVTAMNAQVIEVLGQMTAEDAAHWSERLHVAGGHVSQLGSWLSNLLGSGYGGYYGAAIDRRQEVRYMGNFADVARYSQELADAGEWMWEENMSYAAYEAQHFDYEVERDAYLASQEDVTVLTPLDKEVFGGQREVERAHGRQLRHELGIDRVTQRAVADEDRIVILPALELRQLVLVQKLVVEVRLRQQGEIGGEPCQHQHDWQGEQNDSFVKLG